MAVNTEVDEILRSRADPDGAHAEQLESLTTETPTLVLPAAVVPLPLPTEEQPPTPAGGPLEGAPRVRRRRAWMIPAAIGTAGLIASGTLGGLLWSTIGQRDVTQQHLTASQVALAATQQQLTAARTDAATRNVTADYVTLYIVDSGRVLTSYNAIVACNSFGPCRTSAQQALADLQAFQSDRAAATVPPALASADAALGDGLSAAIAADQQIISAMDTDDLAKFRDGIKKLDAAMLSISKAETALGAALK